MILTFEEAQKYRETLQDLTLEQLKEEGDNLQKEAENTVALITEESASKLLNIIGRSRGTEFNATAPIIALHDNLQTALSANTSSKISNEPIIELGYGEVKVIQKILVNSKWDGDNADSADRVAAGRDILDILKTLESTNLALGSIEQKIKFVADFEVQKEQEKKTGLSHKPVAEDDIAKALK